MKRYAKYKDSGISWIGEIPEHWEEKYLFQVATEHYLSNKNVHHQNLLSLSYGKIIKKDINTTEGLLPANFDTYQIVENGNIILRLTDLQNDHRSLRVGLVTQEGIITSAYICLEPTILMCPNFLYRLLHTFDVKKMFYGMGGGLRQSLKYDELKKIILPIPPLSEQKAIAEFLDNKTKQINELVSAKKKQIELLKEYKQAVIAKAVTQGINPKAKMKDSGITWIGQIPEHWCKYPISAIFYIKSKCGFCDEELLSVYLDKGVVKFSDVVEKRTNATSEDLSKYQLVEPGDFVLNNQQAWRGSVGVSKYRGIISPAYVILGMSDKLNWVFANSLLRDRSMVAMYYIASKGVGSIQRNLVWNKFKRMPIFIPPLPEQEQIVAYIKEKIDSIDAQIASVEKQIANLNEFKQSLISDAVTGKIKVA